MQRLIDRPVPLSNYVSGTYRTKLKADDLPNAAEILKLGNRRYTSVVDLDLAAHLAQLHEVVRRDACCSGTLAISAWTICAPEMPY